MGTTINSSLKGHLLIATPAINDPRFHHAVILICSHDEGGAMGVVINNILPGLSLSKVIENFDLSASRKATFEKMPVLGGGPIEASRGFVIHKNTYQSRDSITINDDVSITGTVDILKELAKGGGPDVFLFVLGYAGWTPGQLEEELKDNAWLTVMPDNALIFDVSPEQKWKMSLAKLGVEPGFLSTLAGRA